MKLASSLDFNRYTPRTYIISEGDAFSAQKALALEHIKSSDAVASNVRDPSSVCLFPKSDTHSKQHHFIQPQYKLLTIPRARRVHQPLLTTPPDAVKSLLACINLISVYPLFMKGAFRRPFADLLILNGPGTCVILYAAVLLNRVSSRFRGIILHHSDFLCNTVLNQLIGLPGPRVLYIESFARVSSLSLSGKLLYHFVDR